MMDLTWVPGVVTALVVSGAQHILFTGKALQRLEDMGTRVTKLEDGKLDGNLHIAQCIGITGAIGYESRRLDAEVQRLDGRVDSIEKETTLDRARYHELNNLVQSKCK